MQKVNLAQASCLLTNGGIEMRFSTTYVYLDLGRNATRDDIVNSLQDGFSHDEHEFQLQETTRMTRFENKDIKFFLRCYDLIDETGIDSLRHNLITKMLSTLSKYKNELIFLAEKVIKIDEDNMKDLRGNM